MLLSLIQSTLVFSNIQKDSLYQAESLFDNHLLKRVHEFPIFSNATIIVWPLIVLALILISNVSAYISSPKKFFDLLISSFSLQASKQLLREDYKLNKRIPIFFSINFLLLIAFLVFKTNSYFNNTLFSQYSSLVQYLFFVSIISLVYVIKFLATFFISYLLNIEELGKEYMFNVLVFGHSLSFVLFPAIVFLEFSKIPAHFFLYPALIISGGFYLLRLLRILYISYSEQNIGIVHIFMYFCALEILPLLILVKFLFLNF